jgi:hypothetical protein
MHSKAITTLNEKLSSHEHVQMKVHYSTSLKKEMILCQSSTKKKKNTITPTQLGPLISCSFQIIDSIYAHVIFKCL